MVILMRCPQNTARQGGAVGVPAFRCDCRHLRTVIGVRPPFIQRCWLPKTHVAFGKSACGAQQRYASARHFETSCPEDQARLTENMGVNWRARDIVSREGR